jgi:ABC-type branched-subunit amino acid transport system substrate-binding protein
MRYSIALFIMMCSFLHGQDLEVFFNQTAEEYFLLGMRQYAQKDFRPALHSFRASIGGHPLSHRITAAKVMEAKTLYALKNYPEASLACDSILAQFPMTMYREDILFTRGMCLYNLGDHVRTFAEMQQTFMIAQERRNKEHSYRVMENIATEYLSVQQVEEHLTDTSFAEIRNMLLVVLAEKYVLNARIDDAKFRLAQVDKTVLDQSLQFRMNRLLSQIERGNLVRIGVLLPLLNTSPSESREKKIASEVLEGIRLAVSDYEERMTPGQVSIELDVQDSEKDSSAIHRIVTQWSQNGTVTGIIGPIFSNETVTAARLAQQYSIPIVSPTATDEGISSIGPYVFQANSTNGAKGKTMAQYAVNVIGAKSIAILGSASLPSSVQADSFVAEAKRLGATIVTDRRYRKGESDLRSYVRAIRVEAATLKPDYVMSLRGKTNIAEVTRKLVSVGVKFSSIDSVMAAGGVFNFTPFFGVNAKKVADSLKLQVRRTGIYIDSLHYPVTDLDMIYCPISNGHEIGVLTSQLTFYNIRAMLFGSNEWNDANELDLNKRYADGVIIGSDRWIDRDERTNRVFGKYSQRFGRPISDNVLYGYDAMSMLIRQFSNGTLTREQLAGSLGALVQSDGIRNGISFRPDRVNSSLNFLQYKNGTMSKLQTYSYQ